MELDVKTVVLLITVLTVTLTKSVLSVKLDII